MAATLRVTPTRGFRAGDEFPFPEIADRNRKELFGGRPPHRRLGAPACTKQSFFNAVSGSQIFGPTLQFSRVRRTDKRPRCRVQIDISDYSQRPRRAIS